MLAHEGAEFGYPEVRVGFVPAMVMAMLRRAVGEKHAADLVLTGRIINAEEAERIGLVSRVVPGGDYDDEVDATLHQISRVAHDGARAHEVALLQARLPLVRGRRRRRRRDERRGALD